MLKTILFLGKIGSNSHLAAAKIKRNGDSLIGIDTFEEIFKDISLKVNHIAIIPLENTITGSINTTIDLLKKTHVQISGEFILKINHCLIAKEIKSINAF